MDVTPLVGEGLGDSASIVGPGDGGALGVGARDVTAGRRVVDMRQSPEYAAGHRLETEA